MGARPPVAAAGVSLRRNSGRSTYTLLYGARRPGNSDPRVPGNVDAELGCMLVKERLELRQREGRRQLERKPQLLQCAMKADEGGEVARVAGFVHSEETAVPLRPL